MAPPGGRSKKDGAPPPPPPPPVLLTVRDGIATITFNRPERYNAWSMDVIEAMLDALRVCAGDEQVKAAILTGSGKYYCSGVDFAGTMKPMLPSTLLAMARDNNKTLFDAFLDFPKPLIAAVNGPAIGASVTSAALCDAMLAARGAATFHTPFTALGITPEGCSSVNFPKLLGEANARAMLDEGRKIDAEEALAFGLAAEVVEPSELLARARALAQQWVAEGRGRRVAQEAGWLETLRRVNAEESTALAESFLRRPFLQAQYDFAAARGKTVPKLIFGVAKTLSPIMSKL